MSTYGRVLLAKLAVLSLVAGTGAYNWLRVKPGLGSVQAAQRVRRLASTELRIGVIVVIITGILVATPAGADMQMQEQRTQRNRSHVVRLSSDLSDPAPTAFGAAAADDLHPERHE